VDAVKADSRWALREPHATRAAFDAYAEEENRMRINIVARLAVAMAAGFALSASTVVWAQSWPAKPVRIIVPFGPGGGTDIQARVLTQFFHEHTGQNFVVENRTGASGLIGAEVAASAPPDGYTVLFSTATLTINTTLYGNRMKVDPVRDLAPISWLTSTPLVLAVHPSVPAQSVEQLVALAKRRPGFLNSGINVPGSTSHLSAEMLKQKAGLDAVIVPYKGGGPAMAALMSGEIDYLFCTGPVASAARKSGRVRLLAVTTAKKASAFPDLPTMNTFYPGFEADNWYAMWFPAGTPKPIVDSMHALIVKALQAERVRGFMVKEGLDPVASTPHELGAQIGREIAKYAEVIRVAQITLQ
jgi:tripartite-type tricarboxylate transporter receptor subunit TctC